jgi:hypothetical protein
MQYIQGLCQPRLSTVSYALLIVWSIKFFSVMFKNSVRTSQETRYVCATETNRLILFIVRTIRNTKLVRTSQETHYISARKTNLLMVCRETVTVYCENAELLYVIAVVTHSYHRASKEACVDVSINTPN